MALNDDAEETSCGLEGPRKACQHNRYGSVLTTHHDVRPDSWLTAQCWRSLVVTQKVKKLPAFYGTTGPYPEPDESNPHLQPFHFNTVLPLTPMSSKWSLPFRLSNQSFVHISHFTHAWYMPCPSHPPYLITLIIFYEEYKLCSSSSCSCHQPPVTSSFLGPNIIVCTIHHILKGWCSMHGKMIGNA
jgi:hypothetical protein